MEEHNPALVRLNVKSMVCIMWWFVRVPRKETEYWIYSMTHPPAYLSPIGFPLVQCEGEPEH